MPWLQSGSGDRVLAQGERPAISLMGMLKGLKVRFQSYPRYEGGESGIRAWNIRCNAGGENTSIVRYESGGVWNDNSIL